MLGRHARSLSEAAASRESAVTTLKLFLRDRSASIAMDYVMVAALISVAFLAGLNQLGVSLTTLYGNMKAAVLVALG